MAHTDPGRADEPSEPWHNSTPAVLGASAAGIAVIAGVVASVVYLTGQHEPDAPVNFVEPSFSKTASATSAATTTPTITSTATVSTTEINSPPPTTSGTPGTSGTSGTSGSSTSRSGAKPSSSPAQRRPRLNDPRTLLPQRAG